MSVPLFFGVRMQFKLSINEPLHNLAAFSLWDKGNKCYVYVFPVDNMSEVVNLVGHLPIAESDLLKLYKYTTVKTASVELKEWKGRSGYEVTEHPNLYKIISYQKKTNSDKPNRTEWTVPRERVEAIWNDVFKTLPSGEYYKFKTLASKVCKRFGLNRYFYESNGGFRVELFQGTRMGGDYKEYYYAPIKVLEALQLVDRHGQLIARVKEVWEDQLILKNSYEVVENEV